MTATPDDITGFLVWMASVPRSPGATTKKGKPLALATIRLYIAAINRKYREHGRESPAHDLRVANVLQGLGRLLSPRQRQVKALREHEIARILDYCDELAQQEKRQVIATRDAAVIAVGFAAAMRRSEICSLRFADVEFLGDEDDFRGMYLHVRESKTDQLRRGQRIAVPDGELVRPVRRLRLWLAASGIVRGPVFQTMRSNGHIQGRAMHPSDIARTVKRYVSAIGLDPAHYSGPVLSHKRRVRMGLNRALSYDWFLHKANDGKEIQTHGAQWYRTRSVPQAGVET